MGLFDRLRGMGRAAGGDLHPDGVAEVHVHDPRFEDWETVKEFGELETARAWRQQLTDNGIEAALTADSEPNKWGIGDIFLQVPPGKWSEAEELLGNYE